MRIRQLEYFVAVAEELHFGRAAERMHIQQPPLSRQIRALEDDLGVLLFERDNRNVQLTPEGEFFLEEAQCIIKRVKKTRTVLEAMADGQAGALRVGFIDSIITSGFADHIAGFTKAYPQVEVMLEARSTMRQLRLLGDGAQDIGFVGVKAAGNTLKDEGYRVQIYAKEPYYAVLPALHPFSRYSEIPLCELAEVPLIYYPLRCNCRVSGAIKEAFSSEGLTPTMGVEVAMDHVAESFVAAGMGWTLLPASACNMARKGLIYKPIAGKFPELELAMVWKPERETKLLQHFVEYMKKVAPAK